MKGQYTTRGKASIMKSTETTIIVQGSGQFPWDMLRYDSAWPADQESSAAFEQIARNRGHVPDDMKPLEIKLRCAGKPTPARWSSFLWACREVTG